MQFKKIVNDLLAYLLMATDAWPPSSTGNWLRTTPPGQPPPLKLKYVFNEKSLDVETKKKGSALDQWPCTYSLITIR